MRATRNVVVVLITVPDMQTARRLAALAVEARLAACVSLAPRMESLYWWEGQVQRSEEVLMLCKTVRKRLAQLEELIRKEHPYETPEFLVCPVSAGMEAYLRWVQAECRGGEGT